MKFWKALARGRFREAWSILSRRPDSEHEQALVRVVLVCIATFYLFFSMRADGVLDDREGRILVMCVSYFFFSLSLFVMITGDPKSSPIRRTIGIFGDLGTTSVAVALAGNAGAPLYIIILWIVFGNGFRYGRKYLFLAAAVATAGFAAAVALNDFWKDKYSMGIGLLVGLVVLPLYVSSLLKKLTAAGKRAEEANQAKNRFLANMSHEMRTPLNGIIGMLDLLKGTPLTAEQKEYARTIDDSAHTLLFLMQDVLDLSKIEAGKVSVKVADFDLYAMLKQTVAIVEPQARFKGLGVFLRISPDVPFLLRGDPLLLRQVLLNLLGNALKFTDRGEVGVRVSLESETPRRASVRFEVVDTGIGIAPEAQRRIFERFAQADESITRRFGGTGLGTTISKEIVEMMGGTIGVESEPGRGSTFRFLVEMEKQSRRHDEAVPAAALADRRALVLSADREAEAELRSFLEGWRVRVATVSRSAQAFARMVAASRAGEPFDFVLVVDHGLDMDAAAFARAVKSDPTILGSHLILATSREGKPRPDAAEGYGSVVPSPVGKAVLFNALHIFHTDAPAEEPEVESLSKRYLEKNAGARRLRVLVAEDNRTNQMVVEKILERAGHDPTIVANGEEALDVLRERSFDIALFDLHMPVMGGAEAAKLYRFMERGGSRMPIVALTADATPEARAECAEAGMDDCLTKPIDSRRLFEMFDRLVPGGATPQRTGGEVRGDRADAAELADPAPEIPADIPCLDPRYLRELADLGGNSDFVVRLAWTFLKGSKEKIRDMERAISDRDVGRVRELAHALKGNSGQIGALRLMRACERFSGMTAVDLERDGETCIADLREEISKARAALDQFLSGRTSAVS